jgi:carbamoyltransferase
MLQRAPYERLNDTGLLDRLSDELAAGRVIGWFQGRTEFGPRALGGRSIIGDARSTKMQSVMNLKIKYRESFRPFTPSVLRERVADYFDMDCDSPYMLLVAPVLEKRRTPVTAEQQTLRGGRVQQGDSHSVRPTSRCATRTARASCPPSAPGSR